MTPTREQVETLLALLPDTDYVEQLATNIGDWSEADAGHVIESLRDLIAGIRPLAQAYLAELEAADRARIEELEGMREWCLVGKNPVFSDYDAGHNNTLQSVIFELDRRIAAIKERKS